MDKNNHNADGNQKSILNNEVPIISTWEATYNGKPVITAKTGEREVRHLRHRCKNFKDAEIAQIVIDYTNGKTTYELAKQYGRHRQTINKRLKKHGTTVTKEKAKSKIDMEQVSNLYADGLTIAQTAKKFNVSTTSMKRYFKDSSIKIRNSRDYT